MILNILMHQLKKLDTAAVIKFKRVDRDELEADIVVSSAYRSSSRNSM